MSGMTIRLEGRGDCIIEHEPSGAVLRTSKSPLFGGTGASFSSTDLLAAALASCIATDIEPVAQRNGVPLEGISVRVQKDVTVQPKVVRALRVDINVEGAVDDTTLLKLERAASHCLVHRALNADVEVKVTVDRADAASPA